MFQISPDQTQWFHLYRVVKTSPITFVIFCCEEINEDGNTSRVLDLRVISNGPELIGRSWCVRTDGKKMVNRAECTKFLELRAKFLIATALNRSVDEIELMEASGEELALAASLDETLRNNLYAVQPTLFSRMARNVIANLNVNQTGIEFEELPDWQSRNIQDIIEEHEPVPELPPVKHHMTTKTQRVPI